MIIYLYGPDSYRRLAKQKEIVDEYKKKHSGLTMERFYFEETDNELRRLEDFIGAQSLFGGSRLAVVSGIGDLGGKKRLVDLPHPTSPYEGGEIIEVLESAVRDKFIFIVLSEDKKLGRDFNFLNRKPVLSQQFDVLSGRQFNNFILKEALKMGVHLTNGLLSNLANYFMGNSWGAVMELEKMALSPNFQFSPSADGFNFQSISNGSIFKQIYQLKSNDLKNRLRTLEILLKNEDPAKVFNLAAYSVGQKTAFADYDAAVKSGKTDYETALLDWVIT